MLKLLKKHTDYNTTVRILEDAAGRLHITADCTQDEEGYFVYEANIHPDHKDDIEYMATCHCEEMAALHAEAMAEFG